MLRYDPSDQDREAVKDFGDPEQTFCVDTGIIPYMIRDCHPSFFAKSKIIRHIFAEFDKNRTDFPAAYALDIRTGT